MSNSLRKLEASFGYHEANLQSKLAMADISIFVLESESRLEGYMQEVNRVKATKELIEANLNSALTSSSIYVRDWAAYIVDGRMKQHDY